MTDPAKRLLCPACHHRDHDPGGCGECPNCELHFDEAREWLERHAALYDLKAQARAAGAAEERERIAGMMERIGAEPGLVSAVRHVRAILDAPAASIAPSVQPAEES